MRDITLWHPRLQKIASAWIKACATEGITVAISETLRTAAEQDALYAQGRTKPGSIVINAKGSSYRSQHQWGIAFDFYLKYLPDWGSTPTPLIQKYGTPERFMTTWMPEEVKTGWQQEDGGWRFYYRDGSGKYVSNAWYQDGDKWYWFDGAGMMVCNTWYSYNGNWYYLGSDGAMVKGLQTVNGKWYYLDENGVMATEPVTLTPDQDGALRYPGVNR